MKLVLTYCNIKLFYIILCLIFAFSSCNNKIKTEEGNKNNNFSEFRLISNDFQNNSDIPKDFTCDGKNISPSLKWMNPPKNTKSFILTVIDPDAPSGNFKHWVVVNIPSNLNFIDRDSKFPAPSRELINDFGNNLWGGPCPPSGKHRYIFTLYAIDIESYDRDINTLDEFLKNHSLGSAVLTGLYKRRPF